MTIQRSQLARDRRAVFVRVHEATARKLESEAALAGVKLGVYIRQLLEDYAPPRDTTKLRNRLKAGRK